MHYIIKVINQTWQKKANEKLQYKAKNTNSYGASDEVGGAKSQEIIWHEL